MLRINFQRVLDYDPFDIRRRASPGSSKIFYKICCAIPIFLTLALIFFMIFAVSPRGQNLRLYQKDIFEWNKNGISEHMSELQFKYKVVPYADNAKWANSQGVPISHLDKEQEIEGQDAMDQSLEELEQNLRSIYYYQQSYFGERSIPEGVFPTLNYTGNQLVDDGVISKNSEAVAYHEGLEQANFCLHLSWKHSAHPGNFTGLEGQETCKRSWDTSNQFNRHKADPATGLNFPLYKFEKENFSCQFSKHTCEWQCKLRDGLWVTESLTCVQLKVLRMLCVTVDLTFTASKGGTMAGAGRKGGRGSIASLAAERQVVSGVSLAEGCFPEGQVAQYRNVNSDIGGKKSLFKLFSLDNVHIEVRSRSDPYIEFAKAEESLSNDLSILFWVSMLCVAISAFLIIALAIVFATQSEQRSRRRSGIELNNQERDVKRFTI